MTNCHRPPHSPASAQIARPRAFRKNIFDETKLSIDVSHPKTTTYGRKSRFQLFSICHNCTTFSPDIACATTNRASSRKIRAFGYRMPVFDLHKGESASH